ncbi:MAG: FAD-dependent oxidoreductase [Slackia isoflavoniconvertens]|nr:FAD-dependent oxidoreductase [Slackia isoflavoniconvertens]
MAMQISRRNFVAGAATVGAMAAFGMAGCSSKGSGKAESKAEEYDIVIVGAGGAGMSAAIAAHDAGVEKVVVLEKEGNVGGNTNFSSSGMNASETKFQKAQGIEDSN